MGRGAAAALAVLMVLLLAAGPATAGPSSNPVSDTIRQVWRQLPTGNEPPPNPPIPKIIIEGVNDQEGDSCPFVKVHGDPSLTLSPILGVVSIDPDNCNDMSDGPLI